MKRRLFIKNGAYAGALMASFPIVARFTTREVEALLVPGLEGDGGVFLPPEDLKKLLDIALGRGGEFAEVYMERRVVNNLSLDEDKISSATRGVDMGIGFRVVQSEKTGYAYSDELDFARLKEAAGTAAHIASGNAAPGARAFQTLKPPSYYLVKISPEGIASKAKAELLFRANAIARAYDKRVTQVSARFSDTNKIIRIANSEGLLVDDSQTLSSLGVSCNAIEGGQRSSGYEKKSGSYGFEHFDIKLAEEMARKAGAMAIRTLPAEDAPAGEFPIVIEKGYGGIFFHEAIGHSLEADFIRKKVSCFWDKLGQPIASPVVSLVDDGTYRGGWGTVNVDDEGQLGRDTRLIDKGICSAFLQDTISSRLLKMETTGNGRRESFRSMPIPRMTNTYLLAGESDPSDIIKSVDKGIYVVKIGGGNVEPATGRFVFSVSEGYMIEGGKVTRPLKGIQLMGNGLDVLKNISLVGNDLLVIGGGTCGKGGQSKPTGFGNPTLKVDVITIGGRKI